MKENIAGFPVQRLLRIACLCHRPSRSVKTVQIFSLASKRDVSLDPYQSSPSRQAGAKQRENSGPMKVCPADYSGGDSNPFRHEERRTICTVKKGQMILCRRFAQN